MRTKITPNSVTLWASAEDTFNWAYFYPGWPGSELAGNRFQATFDETGLLELTVNGKFYCDAPAIPGTEFNACCADLLANVLPKDHPAYSGTVGQFRDLD